MKRIDPEYQSRSSGGGAQSSGGAVSSSEEAKTIINERRSVPDEDMAKAIEWKPWYYRSVEQKPGRSSEDYHRHLADQAETLTNAKVFLNNTTGDNFYKEQEEYIELVHKELDEDNRVKFKV